MDRKIISEKIKKRQGLKGGNRRPQTFRVCEICGKEFGPLNRLSQRFCSKKCGYKGRGSSKKKGKHYPYLNRAKIRICPVCKKEFRAVKDTTGRFGGKIIKKQRYCSHKCYMKSRLETGLERLMREFLDKQKIYYKQEYKIGTYWIDFYIPQINLCMEVDGEYWHNLKKQKERDKRKDEYLKKKGYRILRVSEKAILRQFTGKQAIKLN